MISALNIFNEDYWNKSSRREEKPVAENLSKEAE